jgi:5-hydroxyisourate hydrolase-like protein (transthyretin family)
MLEQLTGFFMKHLLFLLSIIAVSTTANAKNSTATAQSIRSEQKIICDNLLSMPKKDSEIAFPKNEANNLTLWKSLDTNKDDLISKTEVASAKNIIESWEELDTNKDGRIDFFEFSRVSVKSI